MFATETRFEIGRRSVLSPRIPTALETFAVRWPNTSQAETARQSAQRIHSERMQQQQQALQLAELNRQSEERTRQGVALPLLSSVAGRSSPSDSDALTPRRTKSAKDR